ncbi:hypothetical protein D3C76_641530 [compost metagenome]
MPGRGVGHLASPAATRAPGDPATDTVVVPPFDRDNRSVEVCASAVVRDDQAAVFNHQRAASTRPALSGGGKTVVQRRVKPSGFGAQRGDLRGQGRVRIGPCRGLVADRGRVRSSAGRHGVDALAERIVRIGASSDLGLNGRGVVASRCGDGIDTLAQCVVGRLPSLRLAGNRRPASLGLGQQALRTGCGFVADRLGARLGFYGNRFVAVHDLGSDGLGSSCRLRGNGLAPGGGLGRDCLSASCRLSSKALSNRAGLIGRTRDQRDLFTQRRVKRAIGDLVLEVFLIFGLVTAGCPAHAGTGRIPRADVARTVHQACPEEKLQGRRAKLQGVVLLRVSEIAQLGRSLTGVGLAVPDFGPLGVFGASRETPSQANGVDQCRGIEERHGRWQTFLTLQLGKRRVAPDRRDIERANCPHAGQVGASVDAHYINRCGTGALNTNPVAVVFAPFDIIGHGPLHCRPGDGHGIDPNSLIHGVRRGQGNARRRLHSHRWNNADWALIQLGVGVDCRKLARVELERSDFVVAFLGTRSLQHPEQLNSQIVVVYRPLKLRLGLYAICGGHGHSAAGDRLNGARLGGTVWQVQDQSVARFDRGIAIESNHPAGSSRDPTSVRAAGHQLISYRDDVARQRDAPFHTRLEGDGAVLAVAQQRPLAAALSLGGTSAADSRDLDRTVAVPPLQR